MSKKLRSTAESWLHSMWAGFAETRFPGVGDAGPHKLGRNHVRENRSGWERNTASPAKITLRVPMCAKSSLFGFGTTPQNATVGKST